MAAMSTATPKNNQRRPSSGRTEKEAITKIARLINNFPRPDVIIGYASHTSKSPTRTSNTYAGTAFTKLPMKLTVEDDRLWPRDARRETGTKKGPEAVTVGATHWTNTL